nr:hypothetical protein GCM10011355_26320 [Aquisalinus luteolus]
MAPVDEATCDAGMIGRFDSGADLFIAQFDARPDVDDLHAIAAVATVLADDAFACVDHLAVAGAYGRQGGLYIPAPELFDLAFGDHWIEAHDRHQDAAAELAALIVDRLQAGGDIWIAEAGQSDLTAATIRAAREIAPELDFAARVHLVQHSSWNESQTDVDALGYVREHTDYIRIPDGNAGGNGSPGFRTEGGALWPMMLADEDVGAIWAEAKRLADANNEKAGYDNPAIGAGGFDFSDVSETAYIFGFEDMADVEAFAQRFIAAE